MIVNSLCNATFEDLIFLLYLEDEPITDYETMKDFIKHNLDNDNIILAQHLVDALMENEAHYYKYDYENGTFETPIPLEDKDDIIEAFDMEDYFIEGVE